MDNKIDTNFELKLRIYEPSEHDDIVRFGKAISSPDKLRILELLQYGAHNLLSLSKKLDLPISSISKHVDALVEAKLISVSYVPGPKGHVKLCTQRAVNATVDFFDTNIVNEQVEYSVELPVGLFSEANITAPCGLIDGNGDFVVSVDSPQLFHSPLRANTELLFFTDGFVTYNFPKPQNELTDYRSVTFIFEACSEAPYYCENWPSDITVSINDTEIDTYTCPGDYGGRRGLYSPQKWMTISTQFGTLENYTVTGEGVFHNGRRVNSSITVKDLRIADKPFVKFSVGVKPNAVHKGGLNLFGRNFGDFPHAIIMTLK